MGLRRETSFTALEIKTTVSRTYLATSLHRIQTIAVVATPATVTALHHVPELRVATTTIIILTTAMAPATVPANLGVTTAIIQTTIGPDENVASRSATS